MRSTSMVLGVLPGVETQTHEFEGATVLSVMGPSKTIAKALELGLTSGLIGHEQVLLFGIHRDGHNVHVGVVTQSHITLNKEDAKILYLEGYSYLHFVSAMEQGVHVGLFDRGFVSSLSAGKAFGSLCAAVFKNGCVRGSRCHTLLLLGTSSEDRVLVASQHGRKNPLRIVHQKLTGNIRYTVSRADTLIAIEYKTGLVEALHVTDIVESIQTGGVLVWKLCHMSGVQIEDVSLSIADKPTMLVTLTLDNERQIIPANAVWINKTTFGFVFARQWATPFSSEYPPIARANPMTNRITAIDSNGSVLRFTMQPFDHAVSRVVADVASGTIFSATN